MMFPTPSTPAEFYFAKIITDEKQRASDAGEKPVFTGGEVAVASVLGSLYEDLEGEEWVQGGSSEFCPSCQGQGTVCGDASTDIGCRFSSRCVYTEGGFGRLRVYVLAV
jgi:hypothetical protein